MYLTIYITRSTSQIYSDYGRPSSRVGKKVRQLDSFLAFRKQLTFRDITTGFPAKLRLRNDYRNCILMTFQCDPFKCFWLVVQLGQSA